MERSVSPRLGLAARVVTVALLSAATLALNGAPVRAGIGGAIKAAKDKAAKAAGRKQAESPVTTGSTVQFDETTLELTGDLLDKLIQCRKAAEAEARPQDRQALVERRDAITKEIGALSAKNGDAIAANANQRGTWTNCMSVALDEIRKKKGEALAQQIMANPASGEKLARLSAEMQQAQMRGDTAAVARLQRETDAMFGPAHADSLAAEKECGPLPPLHPAAVRIEALQKELAQVDQKIRDLDEKLARLLPQKCGMTDEQIHMAWERIELYLARTDGKSTPLGFSQTEIQALGERKDALKAALKG